MILYHIVKISKMPIPIGFKRRNVIIQGKLGDANIKGLKKNLQIKIITSQRFSTMYWEKYYYPYRMCHIRMIPESSTTF